MKIIDCLDINALNRGALGTSVSIYSLLPVDGGGFLVGCGLWDRENMPHSNAVKDATPGIVLRVDRTGRILVTSFKLANIVYPMIPGPWGGMFVGCRTGAAYLMDENLQVRPLGVFGRGVYGVAFCAPLDRFLVGGRDGTLYVFIRGSELMPVLERTHAVSDDRLWNLCMDHDQRFVWASSYNGKLFRVEVASGATVFETHLGAAATTLIETLSNGMVAVGCMGKCIKLFRSDHVVATVPVSSPVCFVADLPDRGQFLATGYRGQIWLFDYDGKCVDSLEADSRENNPVWNVQRVGTAVIAPAWANGTIRQLEL